MIINIAVCNVLQNNKTNEYELDIKSDMSIQEILNEINVPIADLSEYYPYSGVFSSNSQYLPFVISNNRILYDVNFEDANICDFFETHNITDNKVYIKTVDCQAGGPGFIELAEIWKRIYPILDGIATLLALGIAAKDFIKWFCNLFHKRKRTPQTCFDIVYSRACWNHIELAELLNIQNDKAKSMLLLFGYEYDKKRMQFVQGSHIEEIKKSLTDIKVLDI